MPKMTVAERIERLRRGVEREQADFVSVADVAESMGLTPNTLQRFWTDERATHGSLAAALDATLRAAAATGVQSRGVHPVTIPAPEETPRERRDVEFWQRRARELERQCAEAEHLAEELAGLRELPQLPADWPPAPPEDRGPGRCIIICHTSDLHMGEVVDPGEIDGMNAYNPDIAAQRMQRYFEAAVTVGPRWIADAHCDGALLTLGGDLISGDIHEELSRTNALTSNEQIAQVVEVYAAGIERLLDAFGRVHVAAVPGNHGRQTKKPTAKLAARLNYDILAATILRQRYASNPNVGWTIADGADALVPVYGRAILLTHGDRTGTSGGMGFAGPVLPIVRGSHKLRLQAHSARRDCDLILMGHYHTAANPPGTLANGSVVGYSEFGNGIRAAVDPPQQWLARFSSRWGLCDRLSVQLDSVATARLRSAAL